MSALRLAKLFKLFPQHKIDSLLVSSWPNVSYLSGFKGTESWALVSPKGKFFITDSRYSEQALAEAKSFKLILRDRKPVTEIVRELVESQKLKAVGFEAPHVTYLFHQALLKRVGAKKLIPVRGIVEALRIQKDAEEIKLIRKSAEIAVKGFHHIRKTVRAGETERQVQGRLEYFTKTLGSEKPAFDIIIAAGARASMPHCQSNETKVRNNDVLLVDMGCVYEGYYSDLTRPIFLGKMSALHKKIHDIVWEAQRAGIRKAAPGVRVSEVDAACRNYIRDKGYGDYFGHSTGHGVGLEVHEDPGVSSRGEEILKPGMVITVEPGIYLPGKFGVRIEDMVLITDKGNDVLTKGLEKK